MIIKITKHQFCWESPIFPKCIFSFGKLLSHTSLYCGPGSKRETSFHRISQLFGLGTHPPHYLYIMSAPPPTHWTCLFFQYHSILRLFNLRDNIKCISDAQNKHLKNFSLCFFFLKECCRGTWEWVTVDRRCGCLATGNLNN